MAFETVRFQQQNRIATIALDRHETRNALSPQMRSELLEAFKRAGDDEDVRVVILTGTGDTFCSGGDLRTMGGIGAVQTRVRVKKGQRLITCLKELEKPIIAAVNGYCVGAGSSLALACDLIVAADTAKFSVSFVKIGAIPDLGAFYFWALRAGAARAKELMFTGDFIDAPEAERIGLINRSVPKAELEGEALSLAERLVSGPTQSFAMIKAALNRWPTDLETFLEIEAAMQAVAFSSDDFNEGRHAFLEKRSPRFQGS